MKGDEVIMAQDGGEGTSWGKEKKVGEARRRNAGSDQVI